MASSRSTSKSTSKRSKIRKEEEQELPITDITVPENGREALSRTIKNIENMITQTDLEWLKLCSIACKNNPQIHIIAAPKIVETRFKEADVINAMVLEDLNADTKEIKTQESDEESD